MEVWKDIQFYEGRYQVSNLGRVKSLVKKGRKNELVLKPEINNLIHSYLPPDITISEAETIAMVINEMIWNPYDFVRNPENV